MARSPAEAGDLAINVPIYPTHALSMLHHLLLFYKEITTMGPCMNEAERILCNGVYEDADGPACMHGAGRDLQNNSLLFRRNRAERELLSETNE